MNNNKSNKKKDELIFIKQFEKNILENCKINRMIINKYIINNDILLLKIQNENKTIYHIRIKYIDNKIKNISYKYPMLDSDSLINY